MGNLGWSEMFFIVVVALIVFGPRRLPEIAKTLGRTMAQLRRASEEFKRTWEAEIERETLKEQQRQLADNTVENSTQIETSIETSAEVANNGASADEIKVASASNYENLIPDPEATEPPILPSAAGPSAANSELKSKEERPVPIA